MKIIVFCMVSIVSIFTVLITIAITLGSTLFLDESTSNSIASIFPQGYGYFTKSPKDVRTQCYSIINKTEIIQPNFSHEYFFGLSRKPGRIIFELGTLVKGIPDSLWSKQNSPKHNFKHGNFVIKETDIINPVLRGDFIISNRERLPWAWAKYKTTVYFPTIYVKLRV